ncbi:hypothetical protein PSTG_05804 [Puccinia striiformis f. sp. tritici PST-78]|uniref:Uncharacterized protein n=1 Tax=Puccinia striiformis f. sp. tritici PST-78 TaxID=1165861 RepID=A0A0L0VNW5_9BASI|nr:hypothetical protein PSTG_05804 [Puccinia striiformis f. sp. tritici PST-78]
MVELRGVAVPNQAKNNEKAILGNFNLKIPHRLGSCAIACNSCGALHWRVEACVKERANETISFSMCCQKNKVTLPGFDTSAPKYPPILKELLVGSTDRVNIFRINGGLTHLISSIEPIDKNEAGYSQIFVVGDGGTEEVNSRIRKAQGRGGNNGKGGKMQEDIVSILMQQVDEHNPCTKFYRTARQVLHEKKGSSFKLQGVPNASVDPKRYNQPTVEDVAVVIEGPGDIIGERQIALNRRDDNNGIIYTGRGHQGYNKLVASLENEQVPDGRRVILPSTFIGGPRAMGQLYHDAMAICRKYGPPSLFITMTANPDWFDIQDLLQFGKKAYDDPTIVARVFHLKLVELMKQLDKLDRLGTVVAFISTIEFQKRRLPHLHLMVTLDEKDKPTTPEIIDLLVSAEIPDKETDPILHALVTKFMLHGPCKGRACWNGKCCKYGFPKPYTARTVVIDGAYPAYLRRDTGIQVQKHTSLFDNRHVVAYNKFLTLEFECHINVEIPVNTTAIKYLYKYITKGHDRSYMKVEGCDETKAFVDARYISPPEAAWRLLKFPMSDRFPSVSRLAIQSENEQLIYFSGEDSAVGQVKSGRATQTTLTEYFKLNIEDARGAKGKRIRSLTYDEVATYFSWNRKKKVWCPQPQMGQTIGRVFSVHYLAGEKFYLRVLLLHRKGPTLFADLRTVDGIIHDSYQDACNALGLLIDDTLYDNTLHEASLYRSGFKIQRKDFSVVNLRHLNITSFESSEESNQALIHFVYADLKRIHNCGDEERLNYLNERCILAPLNKDVNKLNIEILGHLPGKSFISKSIDIPDPEGFDSLPEECLNKISIPSLPEHLIELKIGMPVVVTRNIYIKKGVCNGSRMILTGVGTTYLAGKLMSGPYAGVEIMLPKVKLHHKGGPRSGLSFYRYQFPIRPAYAMSVNKSQGQTLRRVGVTLETNVFAHGQLYVALSRVSDVKNLLVAKPSIREGIVNVVHKQIFKEKMKKMT